MDDVRSEADLEGRPTGGISRDHPKFLEVWQAIASTTDRLSREAGVEALRSIRSRINGNEHVDYRRDATAFAGAFLGPNYWKAVAALCAARRPSPSRIADIGCGPGAAGFAALAYAAATGTSDPVTIEFVDDTGIQLQIAKTILDDLLPVLTDLSVSASFLQQDASDWASTNPAASDLVLLSHILTENQASLPILAEVLVRRITPNGELLVIERADDAACQTFAREVSSNAMPLESGLGTIVVPGEPREWNLRWLAVQQPPNAWLPDLVRTYFAAWRQRDPDLLSKVFTSDATYLEKPYHPTLRGLDQIRSYWRRTVMLQEDIDVQPLACAYHAQLAFVEWQATFTQNGHTTQVMGTMILESDAHLRRFTTLREYFRASKHALSGR